METAANSANLMPTLKANYPWQLKRRYVQGIVFFLIFTHLLLYDSKYDFPSGWNDTHTHRRKRETERLREGKKCGEKCETPKCSFFVIHAYVRYGQNVHELKKKKTKKLKIKNLKMKNQPTRTERNKKRETLFPSEKRLIPNHTQPRTVLHPDRNTTPKNGTRYNSLQCFVSTYFLAVLWKAFR